MSITTITVRGGMAPWVQAVIEWTGTSNNWTIRDIETNTIVYTGPAATYTRTVTPQTIYRMRLSDDTGHSEDFAYVSPPVASPANLTVINITATTMKVNWAMVLNASKYEVSIDGVLYPVTSWELNESGQPIVGLIATSLPVTGLVPDHTYAIKVRAYVGTKYSLWTPVTHATTLRVSVVEASEYEYPPESATVYSTLGGWLTPGTLLTHGSGAEFGDTRGVHTTVFLYSANVIKKIKELAGAKVLTFQVSITRDSSYTDARMVLSRWLLHNMSTIPGSAPTFFDTDGVEAGMSTLGQQVWADLPVGWADALIAGTATGIAWGGVEGRFMTGPAIDHETRPRNGTLRITIT